MQRQQDGIPESIRAITANTLINNRTLQLRQFVQLNSPQNMNSLIIGRTFTGRQKKERIFYTIGQKNTMLGRLHDQFNQIRTNVYVDVAFVDQEKCTFSNDGNDLSGYLEIVWFKLASKLSQFINLYKNRTNKFKNQLREKLQQLKSKIRNDDNKNIKVDKKLVQIFQDYGATDLQYNTLPDTDNKVQFIVNNIRKYVEEILCLPEDIRQIKITAILEQNQDKLYKLFKYAAENKGYIQYLYISNQGMSRFEKDKYEYNQNKKNSILIILSSWSDIYKYENNLTNHDLNIHVDFVSDDPTSENEKRYLQIRF